LDFLITRANVDDREPLKDKKFHENLFGKIFADKGYISKDLFSDLFVDGIHLITGIKKNMKNSLMSCQWQNVAICFSEEKSRRDGILLTVDFNLRTRSVQC